MRAAWLVGCVAWLSSCSPTTTGGDAGPQEVPLTLRLVSGDNQFAQADANFGVPLQIQVLKDGAPYPGVIVVFTAPASEPTAVFDMAGIARVVTSASGSASAPPFKAGQRVGSYVVDAVIEGTDTHVEFHLTNTLGAPDNLHVIAGHQQVTTPDTAFMTAFRVQLRDEPGNPIPGGMVTFTTPSGNAMATCTFDGGLNTVTITTDVNGVALAPTCTAGPTTGVFTVAVRGPLNTITESLSLEVAPN